MPHVNVALMRERRTLLNGFRDLNRTTRQVIGLMNMGITDLDQIAEKLLYDEPAELATLGKIVAGLNSSRQPRIRMWLDVGLPPGVAEALPEGSTVWCPLCKNTVAAVPCVACSIAPMAQGE